jgi:hypothetical protein
MKKIICILIIALFASCNTNAQRNLLHNQVVFSLTPVPSLFDNDNYHFNISVKNYTNTPIRSFKIYFKMIEGQKQADFWRSTVYTKDRGNINIKVLGPINPNKTELYELKIRASYGCNAVQIKIHYVVVEFYDGRIERINANNFIEL